MKERFCETMGNRAVTLLIFWAAILLQPAAFGRVFTSTDGRKIEATVVSVDGKNAVLKRTGVGNVTVPLKRLVQADRDFLIKWAAEEAKNRVPKVDIKINSNKRDTKLDQFFEDRRGQFQFEISIENEERGFDIKNATGTLLVLGKYLSSKDEGIVMERNEFKKFNIADGKTTTLVGKLTKYEYDDDDYTHGQKYSGYVFVMKNTAGKVVKVQGSTSRIEKQWERILKLKMSDRYDETSFEKIGRGSSSSVLR